MKNSDAVMTWMTVFDMDADAHRLELDFSLSLPLRDRILNAFTLSKSCHSWDSSVEGRFINALVFLKSKDYVTKDEYVLIQNEVSLLRCLKAAAQGVPVAWDMVNEAGYKIEVNLHELWDKAHEREQCLQAANLMDKIGKDNVPQSP